MSYKTAQKGIGEVENHGFLRWALTDVVGSYDHGIVGVGRDLYRPSGPAACNAQGRLFSFL